MKQFIRIVKTHPGEIPISFIKRHLEEHGVRCGHHGKVEAFVATLCQMQWIYVRASAQRPYVTSNGEIIAGRARAYGIGWALLDKFDQCKVLSTSHTTEKEEEEQRRSIIVSHHDGDEWCADDHLNDLWSLRNKGSPSYALS